MASRCTRTCCTHFNNMNIQLWTFKKILKCTNVLFIWVVLFYYMLEYRFKPCRAISWSSAVIAQCLKPFREAYIASFATAIGKIVNKVPFKIPVMVPSCQIENVPKNGSDTPSLRLQDSSSRGMFDEQYAVVVIWACFWFIFTHFNWQSTWSRYRTALEQK